MNEPRAASVSPANVAMLVYGGEKYGIATIPRLYAQLWPEMLFVSFGQGDLDDWLRERGARLLRVDDERRFIMKGHPLRVMAAYRRHQRRARTYAAELDSRLAAEGIRVAHSHRLTEQLVAGQLRQLGYKSVWQINNNMRRGRLAQVSRLFNHRLARWGADLLLPASDFIARNWSGSGVPMRTIHNAAFRVTDPRDPPPSPPMRCLVAGRLEHSKGHHVAVDAVLAARRAGHDVHLDIYGGPLEASAYADQLRRAIAEGGAERAIVLKGFCDDLRQRHGDYHLGLQCRIDPEPCSLWVCETMVDGLPLAASATGGTPELVQDGVTGVLYPPADAEALAGHLVKLSSDADRLTRMRQAAYERGQSRYLVQRMGDETLAAYRSLLD